MSIKYLKKSLGIVMFLFLIFVPTGCALHAPKGDIEKQLPSIREKNLRTDLQSLRDMTAFESGKPEDHAVPVIDSLFTLATAIDFAIRYNLDAAVTKLEREIQQEAAYGARLKMLPSLAVDGELSVRDTYAASFSEPLFKEGGQDFNFSRDKTNRKFDLELSWKLVDFGISYYQHRQALNRVAIAEQRRRRVIQNLKLDVTKTFWRAQVAKTAMKTTEKLISRIEKREKILLDQFKSRMVSEIDVLETATTLAEMKIKMSGFQRELQKYKHQLAALMGLTEPVHFEIADTDFILPIKKLNLNLIELQNVALRKRPELFGQDLEERITVEDARIAVARMAPNPSVFYRYDYDGDSHLYYDDWHTIGFRVSLDLLSIPEKMSQRRQALKQKKLVKKRRHSIAAAILTQLNIAVVDYDDAHRKYAQTKEITLKRSQLMQARRRHATFGKGDIESVLESEAKYLLSKVQNLSSYADVMIAEERISNTLGRDVAGSDFFSLK